MRWFVLPALLLLAACSWERRVNKLTDEEFSHYYALKVFMTDEQRKAYLLLKTPQERDAWLKAEEAGANAAAADMTPPLWELFYKYPENIRTSIVDGAVQTGWTKDMVLMSWGGPYDKKRLTGRPASRSELLIYRFEKHADGSVLVYVPGSNTEYKAEERFIREVYVDDNIVTEIIEKAGWGA
jgi:hypothetical protein